MKRNLYISCSQKFTLSLIFASIWFSFSLYLAYPWIKDLSEIFHPIWAYCLVFGIALIPGFFNAFLTSAMAFDKRPKLKEFSEYPNISILIAAYNEEETIRDTLTSIFKQDYPSEIEVIVCNDRFY